MAKLTALTVDFPHIARRKFTVSPRKVLNDLLTLERDTAEMTGEFGQLIADLASQELVFGLITRAQRDFVLNVLEYLGWH